MTDSKIVASVIKGDKDADARTAIVRVVVDSKDPAAPAPAPLLAPGMAPPPEQPKHVDLSSLFKIGPISVEYVLIAEGGQWKIDLAQSMRRDRGSGKFDRMILGLPK